MLSKFFQASTKSVFLDFSSSIDVGLKKSFVYRKCIKQSREKTGQFTSIDQVYREKMALPNSIYFIMLGEIMVLLKKAQIQL